MALTGEEIKQRLTEFAAYWSVYQGSERSEAQTFLNEFFACYGSERKRVAQFEDPQEGKFLDLIWPRVCLIEMKRPSEARRLAQHRAQAFAYWENSARPDENLPVPTYVVLCAFQRFEVWKPGQFPREPRASFDLIELPDRYESLLFLAGREPVFVHGQEAVTREAVGKVVDVYQLLQNRQAASPDTLRDFALQSVWCMFAEDLGQLEEHLFRRLLERLLEDPQRSSVDELGQLFTYLNTTGGGPDHGLYASVRYANGALFADPARVHLDRPELELLREACDFDWQRVQPSIFGALMEGGLGHDMQWALGAHYTHEADIRKVIGPSIVKPWRERIENIETHREAVATQNALGLCRGKRGRLRCWLSRISLDRRYPLMVGSSHYQETEGRSWTESNSARHLIRRTPLSSASPAGVSRSGTSLKFCSKPLPTRKATSTSAPATGRSP